MSIKKLNTETNRNWINLLCWGIIDASSKCNDSKKIEEVLDKMQDYYENIKIITALQKN